MKTHKVTKIEVNVRKPEDVGNVVGAIHKATLRAGRHGSVEVIVKAPDGTVLPAHGESLAELATLRRKVELLEKPQKAQGHKGLAEQQETQSGENLDDPGSQNEAPGDPSQDEKAPETTGKPAKPPKAKK
jgi:hypothetical protein